MGDNLQYMIVFFCLPSLITQENVICQKVEGNAALTSRVHVHSDCGQHVHSSDYNIRVTN